MAAGVVHFIYIIPSDRTLNQTYVTNLKTLASTVQYFYTTQLNTGKSFSLNSSVVETFNSSQIATWFDSNPVSDVDTQHYFPYNAWNDLEALSSYRRTDSGNKYIVFVDATAIQSYNDGSALIGGAFGAVFNDVLGQPPLNSLSSTDTNVTNGTALTTEHELGHTFGLDHPPSDGSIMSLNHTTPQFFRSSDLSLLRNNSFFQTGFFYSNAFSISESSQVSSSITLNITGPFQINVQDSILTSDQIVFRNIVIVLTETVGVSDNSIDTSAILMVISPIITVENGISVTDSVSDHYQDIITVTDSLSFYQDTAFVYDSISMNTIGYGYQLDVENIKVQGLRIIGG